jgi:hypothetical protein
MLIDLDRFATRPSTRGRSSKSTAPTVLAPTHPAGEPSDEVRANIRGRFTHTQLN